MKKILLTGSTGQVGWQLKHTLSTLGTVITPNRNELDLTDEMQIRRLVREVQPDIIVNPAAYTAVDQAESAKELALKINADAPQIFAEEAVDCKALLIHFSTDYVFDGSKNAPYTETDVPNPLGYYGMTKLLGERNIEKVALHNDLNYLIFRTSWVYGLHGKNFLKTILRLAQEKPELKIVNDQFGAPTWSRLLAEAISQILAQFANVRYTKVYNGTYHITNGGVTNWFEFTQKALELAHIKTPVYPITSAEYPLEAPRPPYSVLSNKKLNETFNIYMPNWDEALKIVLS